MDTLRSINPRGRMVLEQYTQYYYRNNKYQEFDTFASSLESYLGEVTTQESTVGISMEK